MCIVHVCLIGLKLRAHSAATQLVAHVCADSPEWERQLLLDPVYSYQSSNNETRIHAFSGGTELSVVNMRESFGYLPQCALKLRTVLPSLKGNPARLYFA